MTAHFILLYVLEQLGLAFSNLVQNLVDERGDALVWNERMEPDDVLAAFPLGGDDLLVNFPEK
jgi:hypothetical protein